MKFSEWLFKEELKNWDTGRWIHYSNEPYIKINYQTMWKRDPFAIYLFPEKFERHTQGQWHTYPYKFVVELKSGIKILDFGQITADTYMKLAKELDLIPNEYDSQYTDDRYKNPSAARFWDFFKDKIGENPAKLNAAIRKIGYHAVFDDTDTIYHGEVQLAVLDPRMIKVIDVQKRRGTGWKEVELVKEKLASLLKPYGKITVGKQKKEFSGWDNEHVVSVGVTVNEHLHREGPYASWKIRTHRVVNNKPDEINVKLEWSTPSSADDGEKKSSWSRGFMDDFKSSAKIMTRHMDFAELEENVLHMMDKIWEAHKEKVVA